MIQSMEKLRNLPGARLLGMLVVGLYTLTTLMAAIIGCLMAVFVVGPHVEQLEGDYGELPEKYQNKLDKKQTELENILSIFSQLIPKNLVADAAENKLLPLV